MIKNKNYKNNSINLLLNCVNKKGKHNISKNILSQSSVNISKINNNTGFNKLFEDIVLNYTLSFKPNKKNDRYKNIYLDNYKCISNRIRNILTNINKNKKRVSFDFYFKKEIEKLLDNCIDLIFEKNNNYNNINYYKILEEYLETENLPLKKNIIKHYYKHNSKFNNNINKIKNSIFFDNYLNKSTYKKN